MHEPYLPNASHVPRGTSLKFMYHEYMMEETPYIYDSKTIN